MALTDLTRISTAGIATGTSLSGAILHGDAHFRGTNAGINSAIFDSSENELNLKDNVKLTFGNAGTSDSQFYFDSNNLILQETSASGSMLLRGQNIRLQNASQSNENYIECLGDNANRRVKIYQGATTRFETTSHGAVVTGILTATEFSGPIVGNTSNASGISTFYDLRVSNNLTVEGTTTTLDTNLIGVDRIEVGANSNSVVGVAITQSGTADLVRLYDGASQVVTVDDVGNVGIGTIVPAEKLHVSATGNPKILIEDTDSSNQVGVRFKTTNQDWIAGLHGGVSSFKISKSSAFGTNDYFTIDGSGYVGIHSTSPAYPLDVLEPTDNSGLISITGANTSYDTGFLIRNANNSKWYLINDVNGAGGHSFEIRGDGWSSDRFLTLTQTGKLGVNNTNPNAYDQFVVSGTGNVIAANSTSGYAGIGFYESGTGRFYLRTLDGSNGLAFYRDNTNEALRIDSNGRTLFSRSGLTASRNVGTKTGEIQIASSGNSSAFTMIGFSNDAAAPHLMFGKSRAGNATGSTIVKEGDRLGEIAFCGADGTDIDSFGAAIKVFVDGTPGANDMPGRLSFFTTLDGYSSPTERMVIKNDGNIGIGLTNPDVELDINGDSSSNTQIRIRKATAGNYGAIKLDRDASGTSGGQLGIAGASSHFVTTASQHDIVLRSEANLLFGAGGNTERLRITSNGEVRIANGGLLTIKTDAVATYGVSEALRIDDANTTSDRAFQIFEYQNAGTRWFTLNQNLNVTTTGSSYTYTQGNYGGSNMIEMNQGDLRIYNNPSIVSGGTSAITPTERFTILSGGNVGINQNTPTCQLQIDSGSSGAGTVTHLELNHKGNDTNDAVKLNFARAGSDIGSIVLEKVASNNTTDFIFNTRSFNTVSESMRITGAGNVGINTNNPTNICEVHALGNDSNNFQQIAFERKTSANSKQAFGLVIRSNAQSSSGNEPTAYLRFDARASSLNGNHGGNAIIAFSPIGVTQGTYGQGNLDFYLRNGGTYTFQNDPGGAGEMLPKLRIDPNGRSLFRTNGSQTSAVNDDNVPVQIAESSGSMCYIGFNKGNDYGSIIGHHTAYGGTVIRNLRSDDIVFYTNNTTERLRIDHSANTVTVKNSEFQVNDQELQITSSASYATHFNYQDNGSHYISFSNTGACYFRKSSSGGTIMTVSPSGVGGGGSTTNIYNASDERLKENMVELTDGLDKIKKLKTYSFNWKKGFDENLDGVTQYGFGAHQAKTVDEILVEKFIEGDVELDDETIKDPLRVNEKHVLPLLVKAIQEQQEQIETLKSEVAALKG